jgi:hypothetical protein
MGRGEPKRRRACLYAVIEEMTAAESQGFLKDDANIERLCVLAGVPGWLLSPSRPEPAGARGDRPA